MPAAAATAARENIDCAVAAAGRVPAELGEQLLTAAKDAFTTSLNSVAAAKPAMPLVVTSYPVVAGDGLAPKDYAAQPAAPAFPLPRAAWS
ncbi:MAG: hypothetical protein IRZ07_03655 [Microbispora sp.]|nr:hypothetical protein [Microbispora sp.]